MGDVRERKERFGQCDVHYIEAGEPGGREVILLHGMKFSARTWQEVGTLERLAEAGCHGLALDLPGFGDSPACETGPARLLCDFLARKKCERPVLVGPSMGGRISLEFALDHPRLLGGLVLVGAVGVQENRERLGDITLPTLIVWGGEDAISPLANGELLSREIGGSSLFVIDGAPHPCYLEQPDQWHRELIRFLEKI